MPETTSSEWWHRPLCHQLSGNWYTPDDEPGTDVGAHPAHPPSRSQLEAGYRRCYNGTRQCYPLPVSIEQFLEEKVDIVPEAKTPEDDVYDAYCEFCDHQGLPSRPKQTVTKELKWRANVEQTRPNIDGERIRCYSGIALSDGDSPVTNSKEDDDKSSGWLENVESESF